MIIIWIPCSKSATGSRSPHFRLASSVNSSHGQLADHLFTVTPPVLPRAGKGDFHRANMLPARCNNPAQCKICPLFMWCSARFSMSLKYRIGIFVIAARPAWLIPPIRHINIARYLFHNHCLIQFCYSSLMVNLHSAPCSGSGYFSIAGIGIGRDWWWGRSECVLVLYLHNSMKVSQCLWKNVQTTHFFMTLAGICHLPAVISQSCDFPR